MLVSHSWPISGGARTAEQPEAWTGHSLGGLAVYVFFSIAGYLVTASFHRSRSPSAFVSARARRLFPGLVVSLLLVAFVIGHAVSSLPLAGYLTHPDTAMFLLRNITLVTPQYNLPGVFTAHPYTAVEGSIWTLIHEVVCSGLVFLAGVARLLWRPHAMALARVGALTLWLFVAVAQLPMPTRLINTHDLALPFLIGMAFWFLRNRLPLSFGAALALTVSAALTRAAGWPAVLYDLLLTLALGYVTLLAAYVPGGLLRTFNRLGDYSYGIYLYAVAVQGPMVWLAGPQSALTNSRLPSRQRCSAPCYPGILSKPPPCSASNAMLGLGSSCAAWIH